MVGILGITLKKQTWKRETKNRKSKKKKILRAFTTLNCQNHLEY